MDNLKFLQMTFENIGPFRKQQTLPLADQGLVFVRGRNMISAAADANGTGKTFLFSILSWILFGEGLPGQDGRIPRGDDIACRFTKGPCLGILDLKDSTGTWQIERGRRPTKLAFDGTGQYWTGDAADQKIIQRIGFGSLTFRNAMILSQGAVDRLATADQAVYLKMLDEIQGIDFREALDKARTWRDEWRKTLDDLKVEIQEAATVRYQAQRQIAELEVAHDKHKEIKATRIKLQDETVHQAKTNLALAKQALHEATVIQGRAIEAREVWEHIKKLQAKTLEKQMAYEAAVRNNTDAKTALQTFTDNLDALVHAQRCPTCRRKIGTENQVQEIRQQFDKDYQEKQAALDQTRQVLTRTLREFKESSAKLDKFTEPAKDINERSVSELEAQSSKEQLNRLHAAILRAEADLDSAQDRLKEERQAKWSGQAALDLARKQTLDATDLITKKEHEIERIQRTLTAADYWVEAFGDRGLRSMLFDSVSDFLNERLAHHLRILAAGEADVVISAFKTLKKGTTKEQMTMAASWDWGAGSYSAGSAGQGGRINLAMVAAHQDLAERRSARPFPLRAFDEPESHCDPRGQEIIADWIMQEASRRNTTFVVTHNPILADILQPDHIVTVVLDRDGAHLEYE